MSLENLQEFHLSDEGETASELIKTAFAYMQSELDTGKYNPDIYIQLLSMGCERFLKYTYIFFEHTKKPNKDTKQTHREIRRYSHSSIKLLNKIISEHLSKNMGGSAHRKDIDFLNKDNALREILKVLSDFGGGGRYYNFSNLDLERDRENSPKQKWEKVFNDYYWTERAKTMTEEEHREWLFNAANAERCGFFISKIEEMLRALCRQYTVPGAPEALKKRYQPFSHFLNLRDEDLGHTDYLKKTIKSTKRSYIIEEKTEEEILRSQWPTKKIYSSDINEPWPYIGVDSCILELRRGNYPIVHLNGIACAMNSLSMSFFNLPTAHDISRLKIGTSETPITYITMRL